ncbi:MAG: hypothetical protein ACKOH7_05830, partial [Solirubrobacterales bacterium]
MKSPDVNPVTISLKLMAKVIEVALVGDVGGEAQVAVGSVRSTVTVPPSAEEAGPVFPAESATPEAVSRGVTVPSPQPEAVTVIEVPLAADGVNVQPVAVPALEKSPEAMPETGSLKVSVQAWLTDDVGLDGVPDQVAVGAVRSMVTEPESVAAEGPELLFESVTESAARRTCTVPSEQPLTTTLIDVPLEADGANVQPVAVPALEKSPAAIPETEVLKSSGKVREEALVGVDGVAPHVAPGPVVKLATEKPIVSLVPPGKVGALFSKWKYQRLVDGSTVKLAMSPRPFGNDPRVVVVPSETFILTMRVC